MINKKASLNLSIQAIVILVMAMAILGLGLGFIRTLIGQGQGQFETAINNAELENPATAENPITVDKNVGVKSTGKSKMKIGFYNTGKVNENSWIPHLTGCDTYFKIDTGSQEVDIGESKGYAAMISVKQGNTLEIGSQHVCVIKFNQTNDIAAAKQFYVTVTS